MNARISPMAYKAQKRAENDFRTRWAEYESHKRGWLATHPEATHAEYEKAMRAIARKLGV